MANLSICMILKEKYEIVYSAIESIKSSFIGVPYEIIVVNNGLDLDTLGYLEKNKVIIIQGNQDEFDRSRSRYLQVASGDWILVLDADERITFEGAAIIQSTIFNNLTILKSIAYTLPVLTYIGGGNWGEFEAVRLFKNHKGIHYQDKEMHASLLTQNDELLMKYSEPLYAPIHHFDCLWETSPFKRERNRTRLERQLHEIPDDTSTLMFLALEYAAVKDYTKAEDYFCKVLQLNPSSNYTKMFYMQVLFSTGQHEKAETLAKELISKKKYLLQSYMILAKSQYEKCQYESAKSILLECEKIFPYDACIQVCLAIISSKIDKPQMAYYCYKALMLNPMLLSPVIYIKNRNPNLYEIQSLIFDDFRNLYSLLFSMSDEVSDYAISCDSYLESVRKSGMHNANISFPVL